MSIFLSVLAVIGTVLKWILFVILGLIGLILLLVIIILSTPIRYRIGGEKNEETMSFKAKVTYFFSLVRVNVAFEDKKLRYQVKVAWKEIAGSEKEHGSEEKDTYGEKFTHGELEVEPLKKAAIPERSPEESPVPIQPAAEEGSFVIEEKIAEEKSLEETRENASDEKIDAPCAIVKTEPHIVVYEKHSPLQQGVDMVKKGVSIMKTKPEEVLEKWQKEKEQKKAAKAQKEKEKQELKALKEQQKAKLKAEKEVKKQQKAEKSAAKPKKTLTERIDEAIDKLFDLLDSLWDFVDKVLDAPDKVEELYDEKLAPKLKQFEKYKRLYDKYPRKKETIGVFFKLIRRVLKPLVPKSYHADVHFGTGDPYMTARILGWYYSMAPLILPKQNRRQHLEISTDMMEKVLLFDGEMKGHFSINTVLVFPLLLALFNPDTLRLIRFALKLRKQLKKQKETSSTLQGDKT